MIINTVIKQTAVALLPTKLLSVQVNFIFHTKKLCSDNGSFKPFELHTTLHFMNYFFKKYSVVYITRPSPLIIGWLLIVQKMCAFSQLKFLLFGCTRTVERVCSINLNSVWRPANSGFY